MAPDARFATASTQHPEPVHGLAEIVGQIAEDQMVAPTLLLVAATGRYQYGAESVVAGMHTLLQSDITVCMSVPQISGGGRILDPTGSMTVCSLADVAIDVKPPVDSHAPGLMEGDLPVGFSVSEVDAEFVFGGAGSGSSVLTFEHERITRHDRIRVVLHDVDPVLSTSIGAAPIGLPTSITAGSGSQVFELGGLPARQLIIDHLEMTDHDGDGPSPELPRLMVELLDEAAETSRFVQVTSSDPEDNSLRLERAVPTATRVQIHRHDPETAIGDVIAGQHQGRLRSPGVMIVATNLGLGAADDLVSAASEMLTPNSLGLVSPPAPYSGGRWPSTAIVTLA